MALHDDLLDQAEYLARRERKRPRQASLRRAVSAAYYALFHLLVYEGARRLAPAQPQNLRLEIVRGFVHSNMREACERFRRSPPAGPFGRLLSFPIEPQLIIVADAFIALQDARQEADYDLTANFDRIDVLQKLAQVSAAFAGWKIVRSQANASVFLAALLLHRQWR